MYAPDGKKLTRNDRKVFIRKTQSQIIDTYNLVFNDEKKPYISIDGMTNMKDMEETLKRKIIDTIL